MFAFFIVFGVCAVVITLGDKEKSDVNITSLNICPDLHRQPGSTEDSRYQTNNRTETSSVINNLIVPEYTIALCWSNEVNGA